MASRRQAITRTNFDPVHWRTYATLGGDELTGLGKFKYDWLSSDPEWLAQCFHSDSLIWPDRNLRRPYLSDHRNVVCNERCFHTMVTKRSSSFQLIGSWICKFELIGGISWNDIQIEEKCLQNIHLTTGGYPGPRQNGSELRTKGPLRT